MPSPKTFSLKFKPPFQGWPLLLTAALLLTGCGAIDESKTVFDIPLADDYQPTISRDKSFTPKRILILPVSGPVDSNYRQIYETEMLASMKKPIFWTIVEYAPPGNGDAQLNVDHYNAYKRARETGCDAILLITLSDHSIYDPIHFSASVTMERIDNQTPALNSRFDFDTRNRNVADSARRYYQSDATRTFGDSDAPDKSLYILHNNEPFFKFAGFYTGKLISDTYQPPKQ